MNIQEATALDLENIIALLSANQLPIVDIKNSGVKLFAAKIGKELVGTIGIEKHKHTGLLRSLAVKEEFRNRKIGEQLVNYLFEFSHSKQIAELYLLTTTAEKYFEKLAFTKIDRLEVPSTIKETTEFKSICPLSAIVMQYKL